MCCSLKRRTEAGLFLLDLRLKPDLSTTFGVGLPRVVWRLQTLRRWSHEHEIKSFFTRAARTRCPHGAGAPRDQATLNLGGYLSKAIQARVDGMVNKFMCPILTSACRPPIRAQHIVCSQKPCAAGYMGSKEKELATNSIAVNP
jgi:hypothetical protein